MLSPDGDGQSGEHQTLGQFAVVSYIRDPLARFLDELRMELTPGCMPRAHVTVLPPRPVHGTIREVVQQITAESRNVAPFRVELAEIQIFPGSNVVYIGIGQGAKELREYYELLSHGSLQHDESFPYHPHITLAQNVTSEQAPKLAEVARQQWADYRGPRDFVVTTLSFVQHVAPSIWIDVAEVHTGVEVGVAQ